MVALLALVWVAMVLRGAGLALTFAYIARRNSFATGQSLGYGVVGALLSVLPLFIIPMSIAPILIRKHGRRPLKTLTAIDPFVDVASAGLLVLLLLPVLMVFLPRLIGPAMQATSGVRAIAGLVAIGLMVRSLFLGRDSATSENREDAAAESRDIR